MQFLTQPAIKVEQSMKLHRSIHIQLSIILDVQVSCTAQKPNSVVFKAPLHLLFNSIFERIIKRSSLTFASHQILLIELERC